MKKAYIILAHKNEMMVKRLVDRLDDDASAFFLHIDLNSDIKGFREIFRNNPHVRFLKRERTGWGTFALVTATLNAMRVVQGGDYEKVILLSGQDYPIKSNEEIDQFFQTSPYNIFMDHFPLPNHRKWGPGGGMYRVNKYFFGLSFVKRMMAKTANFMGIVFPFTKRKELPGMKPFSGSQWWAMDMRAVNYILEYVDSHPEYIRYHQHTFAADEIFFQMILLNCPDESLRKNIANNNLRYMKWKSESIAHPEVLGVSDVESISDSGALFARKFDPSVDSDVIDVIDDKFLNTLSGAY
jgi:hypothetical protein